MVMLFIEHYSREKNYSYWFIFLEIRIWDKIEYVVFVNECVY